MARDVGFQFPRIEPKDIFSLFDPSVPRSLIYCIRDLLRYDPAKRLTSKQCLDHPYLHETIPRNDIPMPSGLRAATVSQTSIPMMSNQLNGSSSHPSLNSHTPRNIPPSHSHSHVHPPPIPHAPSHYSDTNPAPNGQPPLFPHQPIPVHAHNGRHPHPVDWSSPSPQPPHVDSPMEESPTEAYSNGHANPITDHQPSTNGHLPQKPLKLGGLTFGKKSSRWALGMFGIEKSHQLPPVEEIATSALGTRKRSQSSSTDSKSIRGHSPERHQDIREVQKQQKKEAERINREAEKERHKLAEKMAREQARAVMSKRNRMLREAAGEDVEWSGGARERVVDKGAKEASSGPIRQKSMGNLGNSTLHAASGKYAEPPAPPVSFDRYRDWRGSAGERVPKARRRDFDDDHSMSSSDVQSLSRMSSMSFATVDSDPGPSRLRHHTSFHQAPSSRTSRSSLRTSFDDFSPSARSSNSFSVDGSSSLVHDFGAHLNVNPHISGSLSPPPLHMLSLSPTLSPPLSPAPHWIPGQGDQKENGLNGQTSPFVPLQSRQFSPAPNSPMDMHSYLHGNPPSPFGEGRPRPPRSGGRKRTPQSAKSNINPIFKVPLPPPPLPSPLPDAILSSKHPTNQLPPFSQLEAVAGGEISPSSPMFVET